MSKVLVISGHPNLASSNTNTVILDELEFQLENVEIRKLDQLYPDYKIDVDVEQQALITADVVILQFPFYWYSVPALMKKWLDDVFSYNFAYGASGDKLKGKDLILSFTVGGPEESYDAQGYNHFEIAQLMRPLQQTVYMAQMNYVKPVYTHRMVYIPGVYNKLEDVQSRAKNHASELVNTVNNLIDSPERKIEKFTQQWFAKFDVLPVESEFFTNRLASDIRLVMPEGEFLGHEGFRDWYEIARATFKPNCEHIVEQLSVETLDDNKFSVDLRVRLIADSYPESSLKGESINLLVNEKWQMSLDDNSGLNIHEYLVELVNS